MNPKDDFAFPFIERPNDISAGVNPGMTLRDYFAAKAMPLCFSAANMDCNADAAKWAYAMADAMLKERLKT